MSGDHHFYQLSPVTPSGYDAEGVACFVFRIDGPGRAPLFRFYNPSSDAHFYSVNGQVPAGYLAEAHEGWVSAQHTNTPISTPLFRFYHADADNHFYSLSPITPDGYVSEGFEGEAFAVTSLRNGRVPLFRFFNPSSGKHFYTTLTALPPSGYVFEGVEAYVFDKPGPGRQRLFRFVQKSSGGHYYSLDPTVPPAYAAEAEQIFVLTAPDPAYGTTAALRQFYRSASDDHFYSIAPTVPPGYVAAPAMGFVCPTAGNGLVPLYRFYRRYHEDKHSNIGGIFEGVAVGAFLGGGIGAIAGGFFHKDVDRAVSTFGKYTVTGGGTGLALVLAGGALILAGPGVAVTVYLGTTAVTNLVIKQRGVTPMERAFLFSIFGGTINYSKIVLTNLAGAHHRQFTVPNFVGETIMNLGDAYDNPVGFTSASYPVPGQVFVHETVHAWQIHNSSFLPGLVCEGGKEQLLNTVGVNVYKVGDPAAKKIWDSLYNEQQAVIVDQWFHDGCLSTSDWFPYVMIVTGGVRPAIAK